MKNPIDPSAQIAREQESLKQRDFAQVNYFEISRDQADQRLDNFILARYKGLPKSNVYKLIRKGEVRINKKRCKPEQKLSNGDILRIAPVQLSTREAPVISADFAKGLLDRLIYEDDRLIVIDKPSGLAVHGGSGISFGLIEAMRESFGVPYLELVHRIDKDTSGVLLVAKRRSELRILQELFREKQVKKTYLAILSGELDSDFAKVNQGLERFTLPSGEQRVRISSEGKPSETHFRLQQRLRGATLVAATPLTGRTHQIRVHAQFLGHALLGDDKYGAGSTSTAHRLCLHAHKLELPDGRVFEAPIPADFAKFIKKLS